MGHLQFIAVAAIACSAVASASENEPASAIPRFEPVRRPANGRTVREAPQGLPKGRTWETTEFPARNLFLNGVNVSSLRNQDLENVNVRIDEAGNIHITAPHYDVSVDASYHPLLPGELPRFPKAPIAPEGLPAGRYSKGTGERSTLVPPPESGTAEPEAKAPAEPAPEKAEPPAKAPAKPQPEPKKQEREMGAPRTKSPLAPSEGPQPAQSLDTGAPTPVVPAPEIPTDLQGGTNL